MPQPTAAPLRRTQFARLCTLTYITEHTAGTNHSNHAIYACNMLKAAQHQLQFTTCTVQAEACKLAATSAQLESFTADHRLALPNSLPPGCAQLRAQLCFCCFWA